MSLTMILNTCAALNGWFHPESDQVSQRIPEYPRIDVRSVPRSDFAMSGKPQFRPIGHDDAQDLLELVELSDIQGQNPPLEVRLPTDGRR
jgi:hypothetical protein